MLPAGDQDEVELKSGRTGVSRVELFEYLLAKSIAVKLFILHRFINLFSLS